VSDLWRRQEATFMLALMGMLAVVASALERYARRRFGAARAARLGVPLPRAEVRANAAQVPDPVPEAWIPLAVPMGRDAWLIEDDVRHGCYGVLSVHRDAGGLVFRMKRRLPLSGVALICALIGVVPYAAGQWLGLAVLLGFFAVTCYRFERGYYALGRRLVEIAADVERGRPAFPP
jgi:hypothetical protein